MEPKFKYYVTAAVLGIGWFLVLLIPAGTRAWLIYFNARMVPYNVGFLVLSSVMVALIFRRPISTANSITKHVVWGCVIPYVACFIYLTIVNAFLFKRGMIVKSGPGGLAFYFVGLGFAIKAYFVVLPYGILSQYIMNRAAASPSAI